MVAVIFHCKEQEVDYLIRLLIHQMTMKAAMLMKLISLTIPLRLEGEWGKVQASKQWKEVTQVMSRSYVMVPKHATKELLNFSGCPSMMEAFGYGNVRACQPHLFDRTYVQQQTLYNGRPWFITENSGYERVLAYYPSGFWVLQPKEHMYAYLTDKHNGGRQCFNTFSVPGEHLRVMLTHVNARNAQQQ